MGDPRDWDTLDLPQWILEAVTSQGFTRMTPVQTAVIPHFLGNKDVVVEASLTTFSRSDSNSQRRSLTSCRPSREAARPWPSSFPLFIGSCD